MSMKRQTPPAPRHLAGARREAALSNGSLFDELGGGGPGRSRGKFSPSFSFPLISLSFPFALF
jgi:hypothetical protein